MTTLGKNPLFDVISIGFAYLSPALFLVVFVALLASSVWLGRQAWRSVRIVHGAVFAPVVDINSDARGLVKLIGTAEGNNPTGSDARAVVWSESTRRGNTAGARRLSRSRTVGQIHVLTERGQCTVELDEAIVLPTSSETESEFMTDQYRRTSGEIRRGDRVFALGAIERNTPKGTAPVQTDSIKHCRLRPAAKVLLVSGAPERHAQIMYTLFLLGQAPVALISVFLLVFGPVAYVTSFPPGGSAAMRTFAQSLRTTPLKFAAGAEHPDWAPIMQKEAEEYEAEAEAERRRMIEDVDR